MAKVSLRGYNTEIDKLIDNNQLDEAIAHCIHILGTFPKHADTYRLLGKAFLERQRFNDAADMFLRVLAIFPDDFVAHIGISIVREELSELDKAVFHMERAFEVQPTNTAIQDELKRLYGKRDGVAPAKIRLTHPALARLYSKGDLNQQALGELSVALADSPSRPDILAQLAELYTKEGQNSEAIETCNKLIENQPYCFGALNVLTRLLPGTPFAQDVPIYQARINELDPYYEFKTSISQSVTDVSEDAVTIEPLVWSPDAELAVNKSDWATNLGIKLIDPQHVDPASYQKKSEPVSYSVNDLPTQPRVRQPAPPPPTPQAPPADLPEWMQSAGWAKSQEPISETAADLIPAGQDQMDIATPVSNKPDLPDTSDLHDTDLSPALEKIRQETDHLPDIEAKFDSSKHPGDTDSLESAASITPASIPDWLRSIAPADVTTAKPESAPVGEPGISEKTIDDAFSSIFPPKEAPAPEKEEPASKDAKLTEPPSPQVPVVEPVVTPVPEEAVSSVAENENAFSFDELRKEMEPASGPIEESVSEGQMKTTPENVEPASEGDALENLRKSFPSEKIPVVDETSLPEQEAVIHNEPQVEQVEMESIEEEQAEQPSPAAAGDVPFWLRDLGDGKAASEPQAAVSTGDELPAWLQDFEQKIEDKPQTPEESSTTIKAEEEPVIERPEVSSGWHIPPASKTDSKFHTQELPELPELPVEESVIEPEPVDKTDKLHLEESPVVTPEPIPTQTTPPFNGGETTIIAPAPDLEAVEADERPAWLSKLIDIDDIELPEPIKSTEKPPEPTGIPKPIESVDEILGASQAAWMVEKAAGKEAEEQPVIESTEKPEEISTSVTFPEATLPVEEAPVIAPSEVEPEMAPFAEPISAEIEPEAPAPAEPAEPVEPVEVPETSAPVSEEKPVVPPSIDLGEHEGVPDLSLIVEGLQAAWMSEHVENGEPKHTGSLMDLYAPSPEAQGTETIIIDRSGLKATKGQADKKPAPEKPVLEQAPPVSEQTVKIPTKVEEPIAPPVTAEKKEPSHPAKHAAPVIVSAAEDILKDARAAYTHGVLDESLDRYVELISHNRLLESVIEDLEKMTTFQPDQSDIWQALGDAYTHRNKLDQALSAYLKAEDLLN